ncbi:MAG: hypothetical protein AAF355_07890 [Myxococcota bacterium]
MYLLFNALLALSGLISLAAGAVLVVMAFRQSVSQGLLCAVIPLYIVFFGLAKLNHPRRMYLLSALVGGLMVFATSWAGMNATAPAPPEPEFDYDPDF